MKLSTRLAIAMVGLVVFTAATLGLFTAYYSSTDLLFATVAAVVAGIAWAIFLSRPFLQMLGVMAREVTEERLAQDMFRVAVESCPSGMIMYGPDGRIVLVNSEMERLFGYPRAELIGRPVDMLVPNGLAARRREDGCARTEYPVSHPLHRRDPEGIRKDGSKFPVEVFLNPTTFRDGQLMLGVLVDISERWKNERLKNEFVSTVSHELRTPLTSIAGSLGLLIGGAAGAMPELTMRLLRIAHKNSERLVRLINDFLDIEKMESGTVAFDLKRVELQALVEQAIEANRGYAESFGVSVRIDPNAATAFVRADPDRLVQVITNLLSNAVKFSPVNAEVLVSIDATTETVRTTVRDRGPGIPHQFRPRIFEKFAQADATDTRQKGGTGLGLSIVKQIATLLGGSVGFADAKGGGTEFYVDLPRWESASEAVATDPAPSATPVLLCDDDPEVAKSIAARLKREGFAPDIAYSATEALAKAQARDHRAILVDLSLPDRDGISLIQDLRAHPQHQNTPIVVISADAECGRDDICSSSLDVLDWLNKPIDTRHLVEVLKRPLVRNGDKRPRLLHIDDDAGVRAIVAEAVGESCEVISVATIAEARIALTAKIFELAVLDLLLSQTSDLDLLPELRDSAGNAIPVILYSARAANGANAVQVQAALTKSPQSIDHLILTLRKHMTGGHLHTD